MVEWYTFPLSEDISGQRSYPVEINDDSLSFALIEIGCRHDGKRTQLKNKKELLFKHWSDTYRSSDSVTWLPPVFRVLVHYDEIDRFPVYHNKFSVDTIIHYDYISPDILDIFNEDKKYFRSLMPDRKHQDLFDSHHELHSAEGLLKLILNHDADHPFTNNFRGKIAEVLFQFDIDSILGRDLVQYKNPIVDYGNKKYPRGTEVDNVLQFYGSADYYSFIDKLSQKDNLTVYSDTPKKSA